MLLVVATSAGFEIFMRLGKFKEYVLLKELVLTSLYNLGFLFSFVLWVTSFYNEPGKNFTKSVQLRIAI